VSAAQKDVERSVVTDRRPVGRAPARLTAVAALVVGVLATAAGAGIGIMYLMRTGLTFEAVLGLILLAGGGMLLGCAATAGWKLLRSWWRLLLIPVALAVLIMVFWSAVAVMYAIAPPTTLGPETPADVGLDYREVTFTTSDGVELAAWFVPSRNGAAVVLKHGAGSTSTVTIRHADVLADHGYGVLMVDARGHGRSGGEGMDIGWHGDADTTAAVSFLSGQDDVVPTQVGVVGLSMGGEEAIGSAGTDPRIRAVVAEGATGRTAADNVPLLPETFAASLQRGLDRYTYGLTDLLTSASPPASLHDSIGAAGNTEFLLVAAGTLEREVLAANDMRSADPRRVEVWTVPDAGHMNALGTAPHQWERRVVAFLDDCLLPAGSRP
jgi:pimeloyl-ACP methyl ester carboxylesterase